MEFHVIEFDGARVVVTGAGGGIGTTLCERFTRAGAQVVGCDPAGASFPDVCFETYEFDFLDRESLRNASSRILSYGTPSVVVLNAGWTSAASVSETTETELDGELTGNFTNPALFCQEFLPAMRSSDSDRNFAFISSVNAFTHFGNPAYSAAKAAGMAWIRALAVEEGATEFVRIR
jgi:NAD(P)-dependent dehydrogenase (short-subunit alcohol dehydrogenase family)